MDVKASNQLTAGELRALLANVDDSLPVFFRVASPTAGNVQEAVHVKQDVYGFFGKSIPCLIIETWGDNDR